MKISCGFLSFHFCFHGVISPNKYHNFDYTQMSHVFCTVNKISRISKIVVVHARSMAFLEIVCINLTWRSILMCNNPTSAGTALEGTPMFAHVTLHRTGNPWGVSAPGGKMRKQLLKDHNFLNNSPIFIIEGSTFNIFALQKILHTIYFNLKNCFVFGERYLTP